MDLNQVCIIGRLVRDAEIKITANGFTVGKFSIAVNRRKKNGDQWQDEANFFDVTILGRLCESIGKYLLKGKQVAINGGLQQERWEQNGQARSKVVILAETIQFTGSEKAGYQNQSNYTDTNFYGDIGF